MKGGAPLGRATGQHGVIKLIDVGAQNAALEAEFLDALAGVIRAGRFVWGPQLRQFESDFAALHGRRHGVGVGSGSDALILSLQALGIGAGDEVIVPDLTFFATAAAVFRVGARPVPVDVEPDGLGLDARLVEHAISDRTRAIIPVHLHGWPVPLAPLLALAARHDLALIEDCAHAHGARERGAPVGSRGAAGCFSFFPAKNLGALGDGGMVVTDDPALAERIRQLSNHGRTGRYEHGYVGYNSRLDEVQAAFLNVKLRYLEAWNVRRREIAREYRNGLSGLPLIHPPSVDGEDAPSVQIYAIRCEDSRTRDALRAYLEDRSIETGIHYPVPLHLQPPFRPGNASAAHFPVATGAAETMLSLPIFPELTDEECFQVISSIRQFFG